MPQAQKNHSRHLPFSTVERLIGINMQGFRNEYLDFYEPNAADRLVLIKKG